MKCTRGVVRCSWLGAHRRPGMFVHFVMFCMKFCSNVLTFAMKLGVQSPT